MVKPCVLLMVARLSEVEVQPAEKKSVYEVSNAAGGSRTKMWKNRHF